jgi:hypothetical protein
VDEMSVDECNRVENESDSEAEVRVEDERLLVLRTTISVRINLVYLNEVEFT